MSDQPGMPLWVKISLIAVAVLLAIAAVLMLTDDGGGHGPGRHMGVSLAA